MKSDTTRKLKELNEARVAQKVRQSQIMRLSSLSRPVDNDTTYFITDRHVTREEDIVREDVVQSFHQKYIKIVRSGELIQMEARLSEAANQLKEHFIHLDDKLSKEKETKASSFFAESKRHKKAETLLSTLEKLELQNYFLVKEYLKLRLNVMITQREEVEAREDLEKCRQSFIETEDTLKRNLTVGVHNIKSKYDKEMRTLHSQLEKQLKLIEEKSNNLRVSKEQLNISATSQEESLVKNVEFLTER